MIEVMACHGGCLGGGGEPKSDDPEILQKRMRGVYAVDAAATVRRSDENTEVKELYKNFLGEPLSHKAETLLHTTFAARNSARSALARFLDCVDRRDGAGAAALCSADVTWHTASVAFGDVRGRDGVVALIERQLPRVRGGPLRARHRFTRADDGFDVLAPNGELARFDVDFDGKLLRRITRVLLHENNNKSHNDSSHS